MSSALRHLDAASPRRWVTSPAAAPPPPRPGGYDVAGVRLLVRTHSSRLRDARRRIRLLEQENEVLRRAAAYLSQANLPGK